MQAEIQADKEKLSFDNFRSAVLEDFRWACISREASLVGRKEVLSGKAKFGIFGDGKEVAQVAMAKFFKPGDFRSGYYRDQTFAFASGLVTVEQFFAQLYADPIPENEPNSNGRQMNSHFASRTVDENGEWLPLTEIKTQVSDLAPTSGQMPRSLGLALASRLFRNEKTLQGFSNLSNQGNEVCFTTIGDAATSEGGFWEALNAAAVMQIPLAVFVWDDGYGISVPKKIQTVKASVSEALKGFEIEKGTNGLKIYKVNGWDYANLCEVFEEGISLARSTHTPVLFHVDELTQPQGHSTSGSHERYKTPERLEWEREWDGIKKMQEWIHANSLATETETENILAEAREFVRGQRQSAWDNFIAPVKAQVAKAAEIINEIALRNPGQSQLLQKLIGELRSNREPLRRDILKALHTAVEILGKQAAANAQNYYEQLLGENKELFNSYLYSEGPKSALKVPVIKPEYAVDAPQVNGYEILNKYFDTLFAHNPKVVAFGEDLGFIGDVNQGFAGLQQKYGENRIFDTGIRELSIMGQGMGLAFRGLRPIAEIQYIDYFLFGMQTLSDDVSTLHYRTGGKQSAPLIVRTRGHRLEGIWHSGSPMGMIVHALRGMHVCVPRNMVQAAGMYNTLLAGNDPGLIVECLNGYRLKEKLPSNLLEMTTPLGVPEIIKEGQDLTIISYGSTLRIIQEAAATLEQEHAGSGLSPVSCEIIDVQTLLPFDINHLILGSLKKTNRILFIDEDVPGGAAGYMFNKVMEEQGGYRYLDVAPRTITGKAHRPAYGSDGDYFSKPNAEEIITVIREMMAE